MDRNKVGKKKANNKNRAAQDKAAQDKAAQDKAAQDKAAQDKAAQDKEKAKESEESTVYLTNDQRSQRRIIIYVSILAVILVCMGGYWLYVSSKLATFERECEALKTRGEWAALELMARDYAMWDPGNERPWLFAAAAAQQVGDIERELEYLNQLAEGANFDALFRRAHLQFLTGKVRESEESYRNLIERRPDSKELHNRLLFLLAMTRQRNEIIAESRRAIENGADVPQSYVYLVGADWVTFTNGYMTNLQWAQQYPGDSETYEVASALHLVSAGVDQSMEEKDEKLQQLLAQTGQMIENLRTKYPNNPEIAIMDLTYNVHRANARKVGEILNSLEYDIEGDSRFWRVIGWFHSYKEEWEQAEEAYLKCLEIHPFDWQCRFEYSNVLRNLKKADELKSMQESAALGKEIMRNVLQAEDTATIPRATLLKVAEYSKICGENEVAEQLMSSLSGIR